MTASYQFCALVAVEGVEARAEVLEFGDDLHSRDLAAWQRSCDSADNAGKPRPPKPRAAFDRDYCREKSREIRIKRERNASYFNEFTNPTPQY